MKQFYMLDGIPDTDYIYDEETYPNIFTCRITHCATLEEVKYEISDRRNDWYQLDAMIAQFSRNGARMIGFNNIGFDYPVLHFIIKSGPTVTVQMIYDKAMSIIRGGDNARFANTIWSSDWIVPQIDLFKIHHYDNRNKSIGLKLLEINMNMSNVEDLPFPVGKMLTDEEKDVLIEYNGHDNLATFLFYLETLGMIKSRMQMTERFGIDMMNHNDTKIGKDYFIKKLEEAMPGSCYDYSTGKRELRQTVRQQIDLRNVIFSYIHFETPELQRVLMWLRAQVITGTKGVFTDVSATLNGFTFDFGTGGIHGSIESAMVQTDDEYIVYDWDVASFYPNLAIANRLYPEHLSETFCEVYEEVYHERKKYPKGSVENAAFKLALNGVYGDSNNEYSPFYDPAYTMSITINGQLLLCMLAEQLMKTPGLTMVQANTDGITVRCPRAYEQHMIDVCRWWESITKLELESAIYDRMYIRDVNSYIAVYQSDNGAACPCGCGWMSGKLKRKGAYCYGDDLEWHKDHSMQVVAKAAEAALVHGQDIESFIYEHDTLTDFLIAVKIPRNTTLVRNLPDGTDEQLPNVIRYVVTTDGDPLFKIMPAAGPVGQYKKANGIDQAYYEQVMTETNGEWDDRVCTKNKSKYEERRTGVQAGQKVTICNDIQQLLTLNIDYNFYVNKAKKLVDPIMRGV